MVRKGIFRNICSSCICCIFFSCNSTPQLEVNNKNEILKRKYTDTGFFRYIPKGNDTLVEFYNQDNIIEFRSKLCGDTININFCGTMELFNSKGIIQKQGTFISDDHTGYISHFNNNGEITETDYLYKGKPFFYYDYESNKCEGNFLKIEYFSFDTITNELVAQGYCARMPAFENYVLGIFIHSESDEIIDSVHYKQDEFEFAYKVNDCKVNNVDEIKFVYYGERTFGDLEKLDSSMFY